MEGPILDLEREAKNMKLTGLILNITQLVETHCFPSLPGEGVITLYEEIRLTNKI
jgi:hypothetical protein